MWARLKEKEAKSYSTRLLPRTASSFLAARPSMERCSLDPLRGVVDVAAGHEKWIPHATLLRFTLFSIQLILISHETPASCGLLFWKERGRHHQMPLHYTNRQSPPTSSTSDHRFFRTHSCRLRGSRLHLIARPRMFEHKQLSVDFSPSKTASWKKLYSLPRWW